MSSYDPSKLTVTFVPSVTKYSPVDERKYTLSISENRETINLSIGKYYLDPLKSSESSKFIYGIWQYRLGSYILLITVPAKSQKIPASNPNLILEDMDLILTAIINSDLLFFQHYPWLLESCIYVKVENHQTLFEDMIYCGKPRHYVRKQNNIINV